MNRVQILAVYASPDTQGDSIIPSVIMPDDLQLNSEYATYVPGELEEW